MWDPQLGNPIACWFHVTEIAELKPTNPGKDPSTSLAVTELREPPSVYVGLADLQHGNECILRDTVTERQR
jgi:hypothetical protein